MSESKHSKIMRLSEALYNARHTSKKSQEYLAEQLDVSKKTIQNWESGISVPNIYQTIEWFEALGINPSPYYYNYIYPETDYNEEELDNDLIKIIKNLPPTTKQQIMFLFKGEHKSSPIGVINLITAYLHTENRNRILLATSIVDNYENCEQCGTSCCNDEIKPNIELIRKAIQKGKDNVYKSGK